MKNMRVTEIRENMDSWSERERDLMENIVTFRILNSLDFNFNNGKERALKKRR